MNNNINLKAVKSLYGFKLGRKLISSQANSQLYKRMVEGDSPSMRTIRMKKYEWTTTLINRVMVNIDKNISLNKALTACSMCWLQEHFMPI